MGCCLQTSLTERMQADSRPRQVYRMRGTHWGPGQAEGAESLSQQHHMAGSHEGIGGPKGRGSAGRAERRLGW